MKKIILASLLMMFGMFANAQSQQQTTVNKKEAKKIANDINATIDQIDVSLDNIDWKAFGELLSKTIENVNQNADALNEIAKNIDMEKVNTKLEKVAANIEQSIDAEKLEKQLQELGKTLEKSMQKVEEKVEEGDK